MRRRRTPSRRSPPRQSCLTCRFSLCETRRRQCGLRATASVSTAGTRHRCALSATTSRRVTASTSVALARPWPMAGVWARYHLCVHRLSMRTASGPRLCDAWPACCTPIASTLVARRSSRRATVSSMALTWMDSSRACHMTNRTTPRCCGIRRVRIPHYHYLPSPQCFQRLERILTDTEYNSVQRVHTYPRNQVGNGPISPTLRRGHSGQEGPWPSRPVLWPVAPLDYPSLPRRLIQRVGHDTVPRRGG